MDSKSIYLTPYKGRLTAFNLFELLKVGNLISILLLLNWWQYSYLPFFDHRPCDDAGIRTLSGSNLGISVAKSPPPNW